MYSSKKADKNIAELSNHIETHLTSSRNNFKEETKPKGHFLTHYASTITSTGPVISTWTMRSEAKHRVFTSLADKTNNFIDIAKTLAYRHQEAMVNQEFSYVDFIDKSKKMKRFIDLNGYDLIPVENMDLGSIMVLDFFYFNSFEYRDGLFVLMDTTFFEIMHTILQ